MTEIEQKVSRIRKSAQKLQKGGRIPKQMKYISKRGIKPIDASDHDVTMDVTTGDVVTINITSSESVLA